MWHWLLTSTTYGIWLPGDPRGSVASVRDRRRYDKRVSTRIEHDHPGEEYETTLPSLQRSSADLMKCEPIWLTEAQAEALVDQFLESASHRGWRLLAASVMGNHFHLVMRSEVDVDPAKMLQTFKSYGSRKLSQLFGKPSSGTWWTKSGSKRKLRDDQAVLAAINYVLNRQPNPLALWPMPDQSNDGEPAT